jgi:hypothetical protein
MICASIPANGGIVASLESPKKFLLDVSLEEKGQDRKTQKLLGGDVVQ